MPPSTASSPSNWISVNAASLSSTLRLILSAVAFATTLVIFQVLLLQSGRIQALLSFTPSLDSVAQLSIPYPSAAETYVFTTAPKVLEEFARLRTELATAHKHLNALRKRDEAGKQLALGRQSLMPSEPPSEKHGLNDECRGPGTVAVLPFLQAGLADRLFLLWLGAEIAKHIGDAHPSKKVCLASAALPADALSPEAPLAAHEAFSLETWAHANGFSATRLQSCVNPLVVRLTFSGSSHRVSDWTDADSVELVRSVASLSSTSARAATAPAAVSSILEVAQGLFSTSRQGECVALTAHRYPHNGSLGNSWMKTNLSSNIIGSFGLSESVSAHVESRYGAHPPIVFIRTANVAACSMKQFAAADDGVCIGTGVLVSVSKFASVVAGFARKIGVVKVYLAVGRTGLVVDDDVTINMATMMEDKLSSKLGSISNNSVVILENVLMYHPTNGGLAALMEWELAVRAHSFVGPGNEEDAWAASVRLARLARNAHAGDLSTNSPLLDDVIHAHSHESRL